MTDGQGTDKMKLAEDVARAIKAEDGAIGRANAYMQHAWNAQLKADTN